MLWKGEYLHNIAYKYGMTMTNMKELCKFLSIPIPSDDTRFNIKTKRDYKHPIFSLADYPEELEVEVIKEGQKTIILYEGKQDIQDEKKELTFLDETERETLVNRIKQLVSDYSEFEMLPEILAIKTKITNEHNRCKFPYKNQSIHNIRNDYCRYFEGPFNVQVFAQDSIDRVFSIYNTIYAIVNSMGGSINKRYNFVIRGEKVRFEFYELQRVKKHIITDEEKKELDKYNRRKIWTEPKIRKDDHVFNGRLVFNVKEDRSWDRVNFRFADGKNTSLENQLVEIVIALYEMSEIEKQTRLEAEAKQKEEEIRVEKEKLFVEMYNKELAKTKKLIQDSKDYQQAKMIRDYIEYVSGKGDNNDEWISWAMKKADWIDPYICEEDDIFGKKVKNMDVLEEREKSTRRW